MGLSRIEKGFFCLFSLEITTSSNAVTSGRISKIIRSVMSSILRFMASKPSRSNKTKSPSLTGMEKSPWALELTRLPFSFTFILTPSNGVLSERILPLRVLCA
jgi:hypothetical protein